MGEDEFLIMLSLQKWVHVTMIELVVLGHFGPRRRAGLKVKAKLTIYYLWLLLYIPGCVHIILWAKTRRTFITVATGGETIYISGSPKSSSVPTILLTVMNN